MADIQEVIIKLSAETSGSNAIEQQINSFKKEAAAIDELIKKRDILNKFADKDKDTERGNRAKKIAADLTKQIDAQTDALTRQVRASGLIQQAAQQELGIIQRLTDRIKDLTAARERQKTVGGIQEINKEIAALNAELRSLTTISNTANVGEKNVLSTLFGVGSASAAGKQVLQGALAGLGIGVGFSVLPALTSSLLEYTTYLLDATERTANLTKANASLQASFSGVADKMNELNDIARKSLYEQFLPADKSIADALLSTTTKGIQDKINQLKALGALDGEVYRFEQQQLEKNKELLAAEGKELQSRFETLQKTSDILSKAQDAARPGGTTLYNQLTAIFRKEGSGEDVTAAERANALLRGSGLAKEIVDELSVSLIEAAKNGADLQQVFDRVVTKVQAQQFEVRQLLNSNKDAIANLTIEAQRKNLEATRVLDLKLKEELRKSAQEYTDFLQGTYEKREDIIISSNKKQADFEISEIDRSLKEQRKLLALDNNGKIQVQYIQQADGTQREINIERDFEEKKNAVRKLSREKTKEELRVFYREQLQLAERYNAEQLQVDLEAAQQRLATLTGVDLRNRINLRNEAINEELNLTQAAISAQYTQEVQSLEKLQAERRSAGREQTVEYEQTQKQIEQIQSIFTTRQQIAEQNAIQKRISAIQQGYADVIYVVNTESANLQAAVNEGLAERNLDIAEGGGGLFGRDFQKRIAQLRANIQTAGVTISTAEQKLGQARARLREAQKALQEAKTDAERGTAKNAITDAETEIANLTTTIANANASIINDTRSITVLYVSAYADAFKQIGEIAQKGYNDLQQYRQQDLDREISAREQRVDAALKLAEYGNTQILDIERNALREAQQERRRSALQQQAVNSALQLSYSLLAVAKAAVEGGGIGSIATVSAAVGAIVTGYGLVRALNQSQQTTGFYKGGFTGEGDAHAPAGTVHRGEFVFTKAVTSRHRPLFEHIHRTGELPPVYSDGNPSRMEFDRLEGALHEVRDAVIGQRFKAINKMDGNGVTQLIERTQTKERLKYKN